MLANNPWVTDHLDNKQLRHISAAASVEPICFKITLILLTMRNALLTGICPSFLRQTECHKPLVPPAGQWNETHHGYSQLKNLNCSHMGISQELIKNTVA